MTLIRILITCMLCCFCLQTNANENLEQLIQIAGSIGDVNIIKDITNTLKVDPDYNAYLLDALAKHNDKGKLDFALHNAVKNKDLFASVILSIHAKDVNTIPTMFEKVNITPNSAVSRPDVSPVVSALRVNMIEIIPYLMCKGANLYDLKAVGFFYAAEENLDYLPLLGIETVTYTDLKTKEIIKGIKHIQLYRTFIGDAISKNRLDVLELIQKTSVGLKIPIDWNKVCVGAGYGLPPVYQYTPLQFALAIERYEIAQFLINHGAKIE